MKIDKIEDLEMVPEWIRTAWEKKNLAPTETLRGLFLEKEQIKRSLGVMNWAWGLSLAIGSPTLAGIIIYGMATLNGVWFNLWVILSFVLYVIFARFVAKTYFVLGNKHHKRSSYIADKLAMFRCAWDGLDKLYDGNPDQMKQYLIRMTADLIYFEERLAVVRTDMKYSTHELRIAVEDETRVRQRFERVFRTFHESFDLFPELTRPEIFKRAHEMVLVLKN